MGVIIGGGIVNNLKYAYDATLCSETENEQRLLIKRVKKECENAGFLLNIQKTKVIMAIDFLSCKK